MKRRILKNGEKVFALFGNKLTGEKGSALVIALLVMILLLGFVALAVTRTTNETIASSNDAAESRAFEAAQASLEVMTRNFDKIFDVKLNPGSDDLTRIKGQYPPGFDAGYTFNQDVIQTQTTQQVVMSGGEFQGLTALRDEWQLNATATDQTNGVQVALRRRFFNNRIPIFQFGIFYDHDLEFHPGPRFDFGGRVHSNGSLYLLANTGLYFSSKVSAVGEILTDVARNSMSWNNWNENVFIKNAAGTYVQLKHDMGSSLTTPVSGSPVFTDPDMPTVYKNAAWKNNESLFQGNLKPNIKPLELPIRISSQISGNALDYVELIKRGKNVGDLWNDGMGVVPVTATTADTNVTSTERYYNKNGIRVSLADSKAKLPGCASGTGTTPVSTVCGVLLNGNNDGINSAPDANGRGYIPQPMTDGYQATEVNGERFFTTGREIWIKVEAVGYNPVSNSFDSKDITQDFLSLGVTEPPIYISNKFSVNGYGTSGTPGTNACASNPSAKDCRSVLKLQRFVFSGSKVDSSGNSKYLTSDTYNSTNYNYIIPAQFASGNFSPVDNGTFGSFASWNYNGSNYADALQHWKQAVVKDTTATRYVVPFPINMFDTREGLYNFSTFDYNTTYAGNVPWNGVMSMVDIDVGNLKAFLDGTYDGKFPSGTPFAAAAGHTLRASDIPSANGWVLYISDRRGDADFDGEYDMEDIFGNNDNVLQAGEDINNNGVLDRDYVNEAPRYTKDGLATASAWNSYAPPDMASVIEHKFYRRGVRLINAQKLPGIYDSATPSNTKGFTVASENGVYVLGNYDAYGINIVGTPTSSDDYLPQDTPDHIPASIAADAVTILSNSWSDARSFSSPFSASQRKASETFVRFAMLAGDTKTSKNDTPNQGSADPRLCGGVHNFKRFLEDWGGVRLNYTGSLINLYNSHNNNGSYKNSSTVYSPPARNWVFDASFLDPNRLPPGTPFFQFIDLTGFQRLN